MTSVAFDHKGQLASGSEDKTIKLWNTQSGELLNTLKGHTDAVLSVAFDKNGLLALLQAIRLSSYGIRQLDNY